MTMHKVYEAGQQFLDACAEQQVRLSTAMQENLRYPHSPHGDSSVVLAMRRQLELLRTNSRPEIDQPLDVQRLPEDPVQRLLGDLFNISLVDPQPPQPGAITESTAQSYPYCKNIERSWSLTIQLAPEGFPNVQAFAEHSGRIPLLRKSRGLYPTAVTAQSMELAIRGRTIVLPPGVIMYVDGRQDAELVEFDYAQQAYRLNLPRGHLTSPFNDIRACQIARFSPLMCDNPALQREHFSKTRVEKVTVEKPAAQLAALAVSLQTNLVSASY